MPELHHTPLFERHAALKARFVDFGGWEMPVKYAGIVEEHFAVREKAGLFDVSHMGEVLVEGPDAVSFLNGLTSNNVAALKTGQIHYSALLYPEGTFVDDLLVYRLGETRFLLIVNASNTEKDVDYLTRHAVGDVTITDISDRYALIALQGPLAQEILTPLTDLDLPAMKYYWFAEGHVAGHPALVSRTGYTGEDGFEVYVAPDDAPAVWDAVMEEGAPRGLKPCGLGARDTLRLEAGMCLYGNDIDQTVSVLEAGLGWILKFGKGDFVGRETLLRQQDQGLERRLVGLEVTGRGIPRHGYPVLDEEGKVVGTVTSGTQAPFLRKPIAMALVERGSAARGTALAVDVRGKSVPAVVVDLPFYKRPGK